MGAVDVLRGPHGEEKHHFVSVLSHRALGSNQHAATQSSISSKKDSNSPSTRIIASVSVVMLFVCRSVCV